ncbi:MAG: glutathione S-transferase [Leptothrix sp. (in: Bacteria)]|nr:glutathione S-transferase [Leptothrix sp. (in: b-proteobacteria)]
MSSAQAVTTSIALLALLITGMSIHVSRLRLRHRVSFGDAGHKDLLVAVRAHGNAIEQTTLFSVLALSCLALPTVPGGSLTACAAVFTLARLVHAAAIFSRRLSLRQAAHATSTLVHVVLALTILWAVLQ